MESKIGCSKLSLFNKSGKAHDTAFVLLGGSGDGGPKENLQDDLTAGDFVGVVT